MRPTRCYGTTRNPWDRDANPGRVVAAARRRPSRRAWSRVAHGNDGMGSIRIPAACAGLVGLKPGRASSRPSSATARGSTWPRTARWRRRSPTARWCSRCSPAGPTWRPSASRAGCGLRSRPGCPLPASRSTGTGAAATGETGDLLAEPGHHVAMADPPYGQRAVLVRVGALDRRHRARRRLLADRSKLEARIARHAAIGRLAMRAGLPREAGRARALARSGRGLLRRSRRPGHAGARQAPDPGERLGRDAAGCANIWRTRATRRSPRRGTWPAGRRWPSGRTAPDGMPLSVQLVGRPGSEALLLGLARQLEQARPWPRTASGR